MSQAPSDVMGYDLLFAKIAFSLTKDDFQRYLSSDSVSRVTKADDEYLIFQCAFKKNGLKYYPEMFINICQNFIIADDELRGEIEYLLSIINSNNPNNLSRMPEKSSAFFKSSSAIRIKNEADADSESSDEPIQEEYTFTTSSIQSNIKQFDSIALRNKLGLPSEHIQPNLENGIVSRKEIEDPFEAYMLFHTEAEVRDEHLNTEVVARQQLNPKPYLVPASKVPKPNSIHTTSEF